MTTYTPIDCDLYDRYEAWATLRTPLVIRYRDADGRETEVQDRIVDLRSEAGIERMILANGIAVRLDHIISVLVDE